MKAKQKQCWYVGVGDGRLTRCVLDVGEITIFTFSFRGIGQEFPIPFGGQKCFQPSPQGKVVHHFFCAANASKKRTTKTKVKNNSTTKKK